MNETNENRGYNKLTIVSVVICAIVFATAVIGFFLLPQKIFVQLMSGSSQPETNTAWFLVAGVLIVGLASLMCILTENQRKWLATESALAIAVIGCIVYNCIVL